MTVTSRLKGLAISAFVGEPGRRARAAAAEATRRLRREARRVEFFHDPTDPWSYLLAQAVERLAARYPVEWSLVPVTPPASDVDSQPRLRAAFAVRDALELAAHWDVAFPERHKELDQAAGRWLGSVLARPRPFADQLAAALRCGEPAWRGDHDGLMAQVGQWGHETALAAPPVLAEGYTRLRRAGHYAGGSLKYGGEWFVGLDRVAMLEERLARDLELPPQPSVLARRPAEHRPPARLIAGDGPVPVEAWVSFRSPYSYLALDRLAALADELPIELRLRPVLPMVQRGHSMPTVKRLALVQDAAREAARLGVPFGQLADPLGAGVERCLAVAKLAIDRGPGPGLAFLRSATRGIWAEARDLSSDGDLEVVVERAGLSWGDAQAALAGDAWRGWAAEHATDLATAGLWGVPSFRAGDYLTWGQDRVEHLADRLRRHVAATRTA